MKKYETMENACNKVKYANKKAISMIMLIIIVIIVLILAGAIIINLRKSNSIKYANEATFKTDLQSIKDAYRVKYDDLLYQNKGQKDKIKQEEFEDIIPEEYKPDFVILPEGPAYVGEDPEIIEIAEEMEYIIGYPGDKIEIEYVNLDSTTDTITVETGIKETPLEVKVIEYYISEDGQNWTKVERNEFTNIFENLKEDTEYKIKVKVIAENDESDESEVYKIKTKVKDFEAGEVELTKETEDGEKYKQGEWTNKSIYIKIKEDGLDTSYEVYGANEVEKGTKTDSLITKSGVSKVRVTTKKNGVTKSREYEVKIDKDGPEISSLIASNVEPTNKNVELTAKAIDRLSGIVGYVFTEKEDIEENTEEFEEIEKTTNGIVKKKEIERNGKYYIYVKDAAGNISRKEIEVKNIDKIAPKLESLNVINPQTGEYKAGKEIEIEAKYSENIVGEVPVLKIKFGTGAERITVAGSISGNKIIYKYTIVSGDNGILESTSYSGRVTDLVGNELILSNMKLGGNEITADTTPPTDEAPKLIATTNSITATFKQTDSLSGINKDTLMYAIKKKSEGSWEQWIKESNATHIFSNLIMNTEYEVKTKVSDNVGNETESQVATVKTINLTKPTISAPTEWTNKDVIVTVSYPEIVGTTRQYSKDGTNWIDVQGLIQTITVSQNNTTIYARIIDETDQTSGNATYTVTNIDKILPTVEIGTNGGIYTIPVGSSTINISTTIRASDTGGSELNELQYQITTQGTVPEENDANWKTFTNGETITEAKTGGTYYLYTKVKDKAGNRATNIQKSNAYEVRYIVKYDANGGSGAPAEQIKINNTNLSLSNTIPTRTGYTFVGWNTNKTATQAEYSAGGIYSANASAQLYAIWKKATFTVTYNYAENGGTSATKTSDIVISGNNIDLTPTATKSSYEFVGWNTNKDATTGLNSLTMQTSNITLYAIYKKTIVGTFYYYNGTQSSSSTVTGYAYNKNTEVSIKTPTITDISKDSLTYTKRGWSTDSTGMADILVNSGDSVTLSSSTTYYASYRASVTAKFYYSGNKVATSSSGRYINYNGTYTQTYITIPSSVTSSSGDYNTDYSHVATTKTGTSVKPSTSKTTYYAVYSKTVTVTKYKYNNSSSQVTGTAYEYYDNTKSNASINLGTHSLTNYTFRGWSTSKDADATINVSSNKSASVFNDTTYYGSYTYSATLIYDLNGGSGNKPSNQSVTCYMNYIGTKTKGRITLSTTTPTWSGYIFDDWYASKAEDSYDRIRTTYYEIDEDTTIYAHWQQIPSVKYQAHVQTYGWKDYVKNGATAGTIGEAKRVEAFKVVPYYESTKWTKNVDLMYRAYGANGKYYPSNQGYNMSSFNVGSTSQYIQECGQTGQSLILTGLFIEFGSSEMSDLFDIWYRVHVQTYGYLPWTKNGNIAGYMGDPNQKRIEAFEVVITLKGGKNPSGNTNYTVGNQYEKVTAPVDPPPVNPPAHTCDDKLYCNKIHDIGRVGTFYCSHKSHTQFRHPVCSVCHKVYTGYKWKCPTSPEGSVTACPEG